MPGTLQAAVVDNKRRLTFQQLNFQLQSVLAAQSFGLANFELAFNGSDLSHIRIFLHVSTLISMMLFPLFVA